MVIKHVSILLNNPQTKDSLSKVIQKLLIVAVLHKHPEALNAKSTQQNLV